MDVRLCEKLNENMQSLTRWTAVLKFDSWLFAKRCDDMKRKNVKCRIHAAANYEKFDARPEGPGVYGTGVQ